MIGFSNLKRIFVLGFMWFVVEFIFTFHSMHEERSLYS